MNQSTLRTPTRVALGIALVLATGSALAHPGDRDGRYDRDDRDDRQYRSDRDDRYDRGDRDEYRRPIARVLEVAPHYVAVRVEVPAQRCWNERVGYDRDDGDDRGRRAGGAILGGLIGGVIGHNIGDEDNRGLTTAAGAVVGGLIGHEVAASGDDRYDRADRYDRDRRYDPEPSRYASRCQVVSRPEIQRRLDGYDVVYQYEGRRYRTRLPYDPGPTLVLDRVGAPDWR